MNDDSDTISNYDPDRLTWAVMLGRWMDFARASLALDDDLPGKAMKATVSDIITLQAVWFALGHLNELDPDQRAIGIDRAAVLIERSARSVEHHWSDAPRPAMIDELLNDARTRLEQVSDHS